MSPYDKIKFKGARTEVWFRVYATTTVEERNSVIHDAIERGYVPKKKYCGVPPVTWSKKEKKRAVAFEISQRQSTEETLDNPSLLRATILRSVTRGKAPKKSLSRETTVLVDRVTKDILEYIRGDRGTTSSS